MQVFENKLENLGGGGWTRTNDLGIMSTQAGSHPFGKLPTLFHLSRGYKAWGFVTCVFDLSGSDPFIITISLQS